MKKLLPSDFSACASFTISARSRAQASKMAGVSSSSSGLVGSGARVKWLTDLDKSAIVSNFEKRGWVKGSLEGE